MFNKTLAFSTFAASIYGLDITAGVQDYAAHVGHDQIDAAASTKMVGIVGWQWFFDQYVESQAIGEALPTNWVAGKHVCYFQWSVEQWTDSSSRWALTVVQNCPVELIKSVTFQVTLTSPQDGAVIVDDDTPEADLEYDAEGKLVKINNIVLENELSTDRHDFGVWLSNEYAEASDVGFTYEYLFTLADLFSS